MGVTVYYLDGDELLENVETERIRTGATRREALAAHGDDDATGIEYARNPCGGCRMVAVRNGRYSVHERGPLGRWGPWRATLTAAEEAAKRR